MTFRNRFIVRGNSQLWIYNGGCDYESEYHKGKVEWHHPCSQHSDIGLNLCESHHSVLQGREIRYTGELLINKTLAEMKQEIESMVTEVVLKAGLRLDDIDKS